MLTTELTSDPAAAGEKAPRSEHHLLLRKLTQFAPLDLKERNILSRALSERVQAVDRNVPLIEMGEAPTEIYVVLEGWASSQRPDGASKGQTVALHLPGDVCDLGGLIKRHMDCSIVALSKLRVAPIRRSALGRLMHDHPRCAQALWWEWMVSGSTQGQWVARLAQGSARTRIANLLCELAIRLFVVGLATDEGFDLPITQADLGASCGLTPEHTNRVFRELRHERIISWHKARITLYDWGALRLVGGFDASYLHFRDLKAWAQTEAPLR